MEPKFLRFRRRPAQDVAVSGVALRGELRVRTRGPPRRRRTSACWDPEAVRALRDAEYGRLDATTRSTSTTPAPGSTPNRSSAPTTSCSATHVLGNPHSDSGTSRAATELADRARAAILAFVGASPDEYTVVFTANASGGAEARRRVVPVRAERSGSC